MGNRLYWRLACSNLKRQKTLYLPYAVATAVMSAMFFIILNIVVAKSISNMSFGGTMRAMLLFGIVIMGLFTASYMFYLNSFLIKRRKKEFGLYGILGLEKRHVSRIIFFESLLMNAGSLGFGLLCGTVFGRLLFLLLMSLTRVAEGSTFELSGVAYLVTAAFFFLIFLVNTVYNQFQVRLANPIDLLSGEKMGEKKLRGVIPMTVLGVLSLGGAYWFSMTTQSQALAIGMFWPAVILVILGTYLLFAAGSQFVLRAIKKNDRLYYRPKNFISVSGLMHRMKQNASGLANICILSTMVLVTVSGVCALYFGQGTVLNEQHPTDYQIEVYYDKRLPQPSDDGAHEAVYALAEQYGVTIDDLYTYHCLRDSVLLKDGAFRFKNENADIPSDDPNDWAFMFPTYLLTLEDFNRATGRSDTLAPGEILIATELAIADTASINANGKIFKIKAVYDDTNLTHCKNSDRESSIFFVAADAEAVDALRYAINPGIAVDQAFGEFYRRGVTEINFTAQDLSTRASFAEALDDVVYGAYRAQIESATYTSSSIDTSREGGYALYGGLLFLGIFFAILFLVNTVLIMYFKQYSEGCEDRERYVILQKVGMSDEEVRATINRQVLIVFFLPMLVALLHILAATNIITQILRAFVMTNNGLTLLCIGATSIVFCLVYIIVFRLTARTYYGLVKR